LITLKKEDEIPKKYLNKMILTESNYKTVILFQNKWRNHIMKEISNKLNLQVLHEDNHLVIVNKRVGDIVQVIKGDKPLSEVVKEYIGQV
jgi:23S rRNA-/tRNA-specific pseudouridylate synthase